MRSAGNQGLPVVEELGRGESGSIWQVYHVPHSDPMRHRDSIGRVRFAKGDHILFIGCFSSAEKAHAAVASIKDQPGFADEPDCFIVARYPMGVDLWPLGFEPKWIRD